MKVFFSWSGTASRELALALAEWFPKVIQGVVPFVSAKDIDKGSNWTVQLAAELADSDFGVVCLTPDNLVSPWLNYEAGAITTSVQSRVCPVLLGIEKKDVRPPLSQMQLTDLTVDEFVLLMKSLNTAMGCPLGEHQVDETVRTWWPGLEERLQGITVPTVDSQAELPPEPPKPQTSTEEMLKEVLTRLRRVESLQSYLLGRSNPTTSEASQRDGLLGKAVVDRGWRLDPDYPDTLAARINLARAYELAGDLDRAIPLYEQSVTEHERVLGPGHSRTLTSRINLARAYELAGDLDRAIPLYELTLTHSERMMGPDHPQTLTSRNSLARAYELAGDLDRAIPLYEQTLADCERVLGPRHPQTLTSRSNLARAYETGGLPSRDIRRAKGTGGRNDGCDGCEPAASGRS